MVTENRDNNSYHDEEVSLKDLYFKISDWIKFLLSKWVIILIVGLVGGLLGFLYAVNKKPIYFATTTFVLEDEKSGGGLSSLAGLASIAGIDIGGGGGGIFQGDNIIQLYKSRTMIQKTLLTYVSNGNKKELLIDNYIKFNKLRDRWNAKPELSSITFNKANLQNLTRLQDSIIGEIVEDINRSYLTVVKPDKKLSIIKVDVKAKDEFFAKKFNDQIVKNVNDFYSQTKTKKSSKNVAILQHKTDSVRNVMNGAIYSAAIVVDATPNLNPTKQVQRSAPMQRSQFTAEANKAVLAELLKNLELSKLALLKEQPLIQIVDSPILPLSFEKTGKASAIIFGGIFAGLFICTILILRRLYKNIIE